ncbi:serine/threonine-protein phosphatase 7 long form homolog [Abrus precatorius]|uniref:Serine/threonine-protein phosphatase 7 long form homolog n=1 Tax=Abrus precatorius TaxID=3816 RepID=A0A8B8K312_ABRPR|nr:serine/threonine-protein phosphatase 7 long form homolog [Abrus precatorius]
MTSSSSRSRVLNPGPEDGSLLRYQSIHVSEHIWNGREHPILRVRRGHFIHAGMEGVPVEIIPHLTVVGFTGVAQLTSIPIDRQLITALVERWRPETHTFHMPPGECAITLQDIAIQMGLRIDGRPVIVSTGGDRAQIVEDLLGIRPLNSTFMGSSLKLTLLDEHFSHVGLHNQNPIQLTHFAKAYILRLIGEFMLAYHSSSRVPVMYLPLLEDLEITGQYSWGSAVLAFLYRELCMSTNIDRSGIGGLTPLVMLWAWDRFPFLSPGDPPYTQNDLPYGAQKGRKDLAYFRFKFDHLKRDQRDIVPLICFQICEWHQPDRTMRQFGMVQHIPHASYQPDQLHDITLKGKTADNWESKFRGVLEHWDRRLDWVVSNEPQIGLLSSNSEYMRWYHTHTRRWMSRDAAVFALLGDAHERAYYLCNDGRDTFSFEEMKDLCETMLALQNEQERILEPSSSCDPPIQSGNLDEPQIDIGIGEQRREGKGLQHRRMSFQATDFTLPPLPERGDGVYYVPPPFPFQQSQWIQSSYVHSSQQSNVPLASPFFSGEFYVPDASLFMTPPPYEPMFFTPSAPGVGTHQSGCSEQTTSLRPGHDRGIDLNAEFIAASDAAGADVRRNPHRGARDRRRQCILTPHEEGSHEQSLNSD